MPARRIAPGDYTPPEPELRHLFGSFAELRARIRARQAATAASITADRNDLDREPLRRPAISPTVSARNGDAKPPDAS